MMNDPDVEYLAEKMLPQDINQHTRSKNIKAQDVVKATSLAENKVYGSIPNQCFQACISLPYLTISKPTCVVGGNAFNWCSSLKTITFISHKKCGQGSHRAVRLLEELPAPLWLNYP